MGHLWLQLLPRGGEDRRDVLQEAVMRRRLEKDPRDFTSNFNLGALSLARKQPAEAIPYFREALRVRPDQVPALNALGAALMASGQIVDAQAQFERALRLQPGYTNARYNLANLLADDDRLDEAIVNFHQVLKEAPEDTTAREHLFLTLSMQVDSLLQKGRLREAESALREALSIHPDNVEMHSELDQLAARRRSTQ